VAQPAMVKSMHKLIMHENHIALMKKNTSVSIACRCMRHTAYNSSSQEGWHTRKTLPLPTLQCKPVPSQPY